MSKKPKQPAPTTRPALRPWLVDVAIDDLR